MVFSTSSSSSLTIWNARVGSSSSAAAAGVKSGRTSLIGSSAAVPEETLLANLAKAFAVEGAETLDPDEFSPAGVEVEVWVDSPAGDRVRLLAVPPDNDSDAFFFRVKLQ